MDRQERYLYYIKKGIFMECLLAVVLATILTVRHSASLFFQVIICFKTVLAVYRVSEYIVDLGRGKEMSRVAADAVIATVPLYLDYNVAVQEEAIQRFASGLMENVDGSQAQTVDFSVKEGESPKVPQILPGIQSFCLTAL